MRDRIKLCMLVVFSVFTLGTSGQNSTSSPYSRYGLSSTDNVGFSMSSGMGGAGLALRDPYYINSLNPASYTGIDSQSFVVEAGFFGKVTSFNNGNEKETANDANFQYFAMAFPISRYIGTSVGIKPYTNVGYAYSSTDSSAAAGNYRAAYDGGGSVNQVYWGTGFRPVKPLSVGVTASYLFGKIYHDKSVVFEDPSFLSGHQRDELYVHNIMMQFGLQYEWMLNKTDKVIFGATYTPKFGAASAFSQNTSSIADTITTSSEQKLKLPERMGMGVTYSNSHWMVTGDMRTERWEKNEGYFISSSEGLTDKTRYSAGVQYLNDPYSRNIFKRIQYRSGIHYTDTNIEVRGHQINEFGISFGAAIPVRGIQSTLNVAFEFGRRGTTTDGLVQEDYAKIMVSLSLYDVWFFKRKFE